MTMILGTIRGYANVFNELSAPLGTDEPFRAIIRPGAFWLHGVITGTVMHGSAKIGTTWDRSLRLWQDGYGLAIEIDIPATLAGCGMRDMVATGINAMSIGLDIKSSTDFYDEDGVLCREVTRADIDHVTICDCGAFASACCWVAGTPAAHMSPEIAAASRRWHFGVIDREKKQAADRAMLKRYFAKIDADRQRPANRKKWKPELLQIPEIPAAWRAAMEAGLYL
jgi:uncharacterized protein